MKKNKYLAFVFAILALVDTHAACIIITNDYVHGYYASKYMYASAPAWLAFLWIIPFGFGLLLFSLLSIKFYKAYKQSLQNLKETDE